MPETTMTAEDRTRSCPYPSVADMEAAVRELEDDIPPLAFKRTRRPWPYDGPEGRARLTGSLDTGGSFTGEDHDDDPEEQS